MPTTLKEGSKILFDTINYKLRHQDYQRTLDVAKDFTTYATGHGIAEKLRRFNRRETESEFDQRVLLTQVNTPDIFASCTKPMYKMGRVPATITATWENADAQDNDKKTKQLFDAGKNFWGKKSVQKYIAQRQADLDSMDPNSFVVVEFKEKVDPTNPDIKANPYPFEVNSAEAINYFYNNMELQWLVVLNYDIMVDSKKLEYVAEKYYMYLDNEAITALQIHKDMVKDYVLQNNAIVIDSTTVIAPGQIYLFKTGTDKKNKDDRFYIIRVSEHKIGFVPAKRFGTVLDPQTRNRTCLPLVVTAQAYFEKSIKTMSEFDLTNCLHTFPQKLQYADPCPGEVIETKDGHQLMGCQNGYRPDGKTMCGSCKGSGFKFHTSSQDLIQIRMPKPGEPIQSLENIIAYKSPPIDLVEFQKNFGFFELRKLAQGAVYNSDVFSRSEVTKTATEKVIDLDAVYDTLSTFADSWSEMFVHIYRCIAALRNIDKGMTLEHRFPSDFKMESFTQLLDDLQKATTNSAPSHIKKAITKKITNKVYVDEPRKILEIDTKEKFNPFPGKNETEIQFILASGLTTTFNTIFHSNFDFVFSEIEYEQNKKGIDFYVMDETAQRALIKAKVDELAKLIDEQNAAATASAFNAAPIEGKTNPDGSPIDTNEEETAV